MLTTAAGMVFPAKVFVIGAAVAGLQAIATARRLGVTLLERPLRVTTLVSAVRSAVRARQRQYQIRGHLAERARDRGVPPHRRPAQGRIPRDARP